MASSQPNRSPAERARHFRTLAEGAYRLADECDCPEVIDDFLRIAARLIKFAEEAESQVRGGAAAPEAEPKAGGGDRPQAPTRPHP